MDTTISCDYMTLMVMLMDSLKGEVRWVRAGHDPAVVYDQRQDRFEELNGDGMALGIDRGFVFREYCRSNITSDQLIAVGTDGIWEAENPQGAKFGRDRFRQAIRSYSRRPSQEILKASLENLASFQKTASQNDDITLVVVKTKSPERKVLQ
jgi:sigma-B regulation protein RsbU (phosphoserine phosphatase)